jgi:tyrosine-protein phosphatase SIW14
MKKYVLSLGAALLGAIFVASPAPSLAQESTQNNDLSQIKIGNFGKMDDRLYRGAQPVKEDYASLAALGVKTVVDLRNDPTDYEKPAVEALGMKYVNIPMSGWKYANDQDVEKFMSIMNDPESGVVYVHCKAGKHRTGLVGAVYRFHKYGWDYDQAYKEMKKFDYTSWPVHFNIKSYVKDYSERFEKTKAAAAAQSVSAPVAAIATSN